MKNQTNNVMSDNTPVPVRPWWQRLLAMVIIAVLLVAGIFASRHLMKTKPKATRKPPAKMQTLVRTIAASPEDINAAIHVFGNIVPAREVTLMARVSGEALYLHPKLLPGGMVRKGEVLVRLDKTDHQINLQQKENALANALADLRIEQGNQAVAKNEWELINKLAKNIDTTNQDLALRKPQLDKAKAAIKVAETNLEKARLDLQRTEITAPFNAVVLQKNIDIGSQVSNQSSIATLVDIDAFWALLSLPVEKTPWLDLPSENTPGSTVYISSNSKAVYEGKIINLLPDLDKEGMMARILVEIQDPMGMQSQNPPLHIGSFIEAEILGKKIANVYKIPRSSLREGDTILTATPEDRLGIQTVSVAWKDADWAYIESGIDSATNIIISNVPAPLEGMPLKRLQDKTDRENRKEKAKSGQK